MSTRVYSPAGEPFDIPRRDLADKLILEQGWTQTPPVAVAPVEEEKPALKRRARRKKSEEEDAQIEEAADAAPDEPIEETGDDVVVEFPEDDE